MDLKNAKEAIQVLSEVKRPKGDPTKTFKRGVFFAFALVSVLYLLANIAYVCQPVKSF